MNEINGMNFLNDVSWFLKLQLRVTTKRVDNETRLFQSRSLSEKDLSGDWEDVRRKILWAGGLKDLPNSIPGQVST